MSFDSWIDAQIRGAQERGEFDDLPGMGKPLAAIEGPHDEMWWVKQLLAREGLSFLPPALAIRGEAQKVLAQIGELDSETAVRRVVGDLNERIREINRKPEINGPPSTLMPLDVEALVERWRSTHVPVDARTDVAPVEPAPQVGRRRRRRWFHRSVTASPTR
jgi:hypothetical protein